MSKKDQERFEDCYLLALSLLFRPAGDVTKLSGKEIALFTQAGVLTDDACWHYFDAADMPEGCVRVGDIKYRDSNSREVILIASKVGRFRMAQQPLFRMAYGFGVLESAVSWQRYRVVVAEYASIVLAGHKGRKLRAIMARLGYKSDDATEEPAAFDQTVDYDGVVFVHSKHRLHPKFTNKQRDSVETTTVDEVSALHSKYTKLGRAVVIVNGAGALYADVIVLIPRVAVILIQCKYCGDGTELEISDVVGNMKPEVAALSTIANLPQDSKTPNYFRVLATNEQLAPEALKGSGLATLNTSDPSALAPVFTPIHMPPFGTEELFSEIHTFKNT